MSASDSVLAVLDSYGEHIGRLVPRSHAEGYLMFICYISTGDTPWRMSLIVEFVGVENDRVVAGEKLRKEHARRVSRN